MLQDPNVDRFVRETIRPLQKKIDLLEKEIAKLKKIVKQIEDRPNYSNSQPI